MAVIAAGLLISAALTNDFTKELNTKGAGDTDWIVVMPFLVFGGVFKISPDFELVHPVPINVIKFTTIKFTNLVFIVLPPCTQVLKPHF